MKTVILTVIVFVLGLAPASAQHSDDLDTTLERLMTGLSGAFDSGAQLRAEILSKAPSDKTHQHVYRSFTRIDAPEVGENVFVVTLRDDGPEGRIDMVEFQVWTLTIDQDRGAVEMAPQRFRNPNAYTNVTRDPTAFEGLKAVDLVPSDGAASCPIYWRPTHNDLIHGVSEAPCLGPIRDKMLSWEWTYILSDTALWMSFAGRDDAGEIVFGRQDQLPWRLDKVE